MVVLGFGTAVAAYRQQFASWLVADWSHWAFTLVFAILLVTVIELVKHERDRERESHVYFRPWHFEARCRDQIKNGKETLTGHVSASLTGRIFNSGELSVEFNVREIELLEKSGMSWKPIEMDVKDRAWKNDKGWDRASIAPKSSMECSAWLDGCYKPGLSQIFGKALKFSLVLDAIGQEPMTIEREFEFVNGSSEARWYDSRYR